MLMKAGKSFYHEETMLGDNEPLEGLQIFIRPAQKDLVPQVSFLTLDTLHSEDDWRLLASPNPETPFQFSSQTWLYDMKLLKGSRATLPSLSRTDLTSLLYVFKGGISVNETIYLAAKESLVVHHEIILMAAIEDTELVLFVTDERASIFKDGMYSGNKAQ